MRTMSKTSIACLLVLGLASSVYGQDKRSRHDFDFIRSSSPWMTSGNAAGLNATPVDRASMIEGTFTKEDGGIIGNEGSENSFKVGAETESYLKISEKLYFHGKLSYSYFNGKDMGGSVMMNPLENPVNFYEVSDTTVGVKVREAYDLVGGLSYQVGKKLAIGAEIDYASIDQAKLKDPRFLNVRMNLDLNAGFRYTCCDAFSFGMSALYERNIETFRGDVYGTTDKQYYSYVDYGGFLGTRELFDGTNGFVPTGDNRPMFNSLYGGSLQFEFGRKARMFNSLTYKKRNGYFGNPGSSNVKFTEHSGDIFEYEGVITIDKGSSFHRIGLDFRYEGLSNLENVYRHTTEVGSTTVVEYFTKNEILDRSDINAGLSYRGYLGVSEYLPKWEYGVDARYSDRRSVTTLYPFYRKSNTGAFAFSIDGKRNILSGKNLFSVMLQADFLTGNGTPKEDGQFAESAENSLHSIDNYMYREFEYLTASRVGAGLKFRYTRLFSDKIAGYVQLSDRFVSLTEKPEYLSNGSRNTLAITIGCTF